MDDAGTIHLHPVLNLHPALVASLSVSKLSPHSVSVEQLPLPVEEDLEIVVVVEAVVVVGTRTLPARGQGLAQETSGRRSNRQSKLPLLPVLLKHSEVAKSLDHGLATKGKEF